MTGPTPRAEFVALVAMLTATIALSIDAMLPALPRIGADLLPADPNQAQLVITGFVLGLGIGTLLTGPMSDAWGRRPVILGGIAIYVLGAALASMAPTLEWLLVARALQGLGAAGPRVAALAMVRDRHQGAAMAQLMSFVMMVFSLVPAIAPSIGAAIALVAGWRGIFGAFVVFGLAVGLWFWLRQPETLAPAQRRPLRLAELWAALREVLGNRSARLAIGAQTLAFGMLFATLSTTQLVFDQTYGRGAGFPLWFMLIAVVSAQAGWVNARLVGRIGMRGMVVRAFGGLLGLTAAMGVALALPLGAGTEFWVYLIWTIGVFSMVGLTVGNLNAILMEPLGHIAGLAASVSSSVATVGAVVIAVPVGLAFSGTPLPQVLAFGALLILAIIVARALPLPARG